MSKPLSLDDFRAVRIVLEDEDFAMVEGPEGPPTDLIDREVWNGIVTLRLLRMAGENMLLPFRENERHSLMMAAKEFSCLREFRTVRIGGLPNR
jgi:hypothetical protein